MRSTLLVSAIFSALALWALSLYFGLPLSGFFGTASLASVEHTLISTLAGLIGGGVGLFWSRANAH